VANDVTHKPNGSLSLFSIRHTHTATLPNYVASRQRHIGANNLITALTGKKELNSQSPNHDSDAQTITQPYIKYTFSPQKTCN